MKNVIIKVNNDTQTIAEHQVTATQSEGVVIQATSDVNYELFDMAIGRAPNHIITKRIDDDLHISLQAEGKHSDVIIQNFYQYSHSALIGASEDNRFYYYVPDTGEIPSYVTELSSGQADGQALGGMPQPNAWWISEAYAPTGVPSGVDALPWLVGLASVIGAAGIAALVIDHNNEDEDEQNPTTGAQESETEESSQIDSSELSESVVTETMVNEQIVTKKIATETIVTEPVISEPLLNEPKTTEAEGTAATEAIEAQSTLSVYSAFYDVTVPQDAIHIDSNIKLPQSTSDGLTSTTLSLVDTLSSASDFENSMIQEPDLIEAIDIFNQLNVEPIALLDEIEQTLQTEILAVANDQAAAISVVSVTNVNSLSNERLFNHCDTIASIDSLYLINASDINQVL